MKIFNLFLISVTGPGSNISCHHCSTMDDLAKMIMCATCGEHFHTNCVGLINTPGQVTFDCKLGTE